MLIDTAIAIPLTHSDRQQATDFSQGQVTPARQLQVYRNTLAVCAVNIYLQWMGVKPDLERSYSHRDHDRFALNVADLYLPGIGRFECRPIAPGATYCDIPPEVQNNRCGYIAVEIEAEAQEAKLLGFLSPAQINLANDQVPLRSFQSLDTFLEALEPRWVKLENWIQQEFEQQWQAIQDFTGPQSQLAFMGTEAHAMSIPVTPQDVPLELLTQLNAAQDDETRWRIIEQIWTIAPDHPATGVRRISDLGFYLDGASVALMVAILPKSNQEYALLVRLYPMQNALLPEGLHLSGLYETGEAFLTAQSRTQDNYIQLKFSAEPGEQFGLRVRYQEAEIMENFIVPE
ncbi:DUF1822 family protein [filamentous cyanobacterium LEGE 11480]|uniref:DUF1822 family protein n=1 Tax=Romeriopsis navalis LEGE 11480 TaxID=2777977 RepID=A0A928Z5V8_9CYAN|nr:DUF1822 family protein [Romeriopsis navalis]MBE9031908.1 DUF1822 family protein [Romeriopsis navalis LEGE 11480]